MRYTIATEGEATVDNRTLEPGALEWEDKIYPVTLAFDNQQIIATATDIRREDDGRITANIEMNLTQTGEVIKDLDTGQPGAFVMATPEIPEDLFPVISVSAVESVVVLARIVDSEQQSLTKIVHGKLRTIALTPRPAWPKNQARP